MVRGNQPGIKARLKAPPRPDIPIVTGVDTSHGRRVRHTIKAVTAPAWSKFPGLAQTLPTAPAQSPSADPTTARSPNEPPTSSSRVPLPTRQAGSSRTERRLTPGPLGDRQPPLLGTGRHVQQRLQAQVRQLAATLICSVYDGNKTTAVSATRAIHPLRTHQSHQTPNKPLTTHRAC